MVNVLPLSSIWGIGWEGWAKSPQSFFSLSFLVPPACFQKEKQVQVIFVCSFISSWVPISVLRILYIHTCSVRSFVRSLSWMSFGKSHFYTSPTRTDPTNNNGLTSNLRTHHCNYICVVHSCPCLWPQNTKITTTIAATTYSYCLYESFAPTATNTRQPQALLFTKLHTSAACVGKSADRFLYHPIGHIATLGAW